MAHSYVRIGRRLTCAELCAFVHKRSFIIRNPAKSIPSYYYLDPDIVEDEIGYEQQYQLFQKITELSGQIPSPFFSFLYRLIQINTIIEFI